MAAVSAVSLFSDEQQPYPIYIYIYIYIVHECIYIVNAFRGYFQESGTKKPAY